MPLRFDKRERDERLGDWPRDTGIPPDMPQNERNLVRQTPGLGIPCPHCRGKGCAWCRSTGYVDPQEEAALRAPHVASPIFEEPLADFANPSRPTVNLHQEDRQHWGDVYPCPNCGGAVRRDYRECPQCGEHSQPPVGGPAGEQAQPMRWARVADISMPPEGSPSVGNPPAEPYNPGAYEGMVESLHPAAQYKYQRSVQEGQSPQAAMQAAQEQQQDMMVRQNQGQNTEGVMIPVVGAVEGNPLVELVNDTLEGFVPFSSVQRFAKLLS